VISRVVTRLVGWTGGIFHEIERTGPPLPDGPVLLAANHANALLDPLVVFKAAGRPSRPLAKAPLFEHPIIGPFLWALGGLPVYRRQDDPTQMGKNQDTFDAAIQALHRGEVVQIYPEGQSHSEPGLTQLKTGAARIALQAEERAGWKLGLTIVPVGLTYQRKHRFRGSALLTAGQPIPVASWRAAYEADTAAAVDGLTDAVRAGLEAVTLNFVADGDRELVEIAEALYARETEATPWTGRPGLAERWPRLRSFTEGLAWLRAHDPERHGRLSHRVARYAQLTALLGADQGAVPERYRWDRVVRYALRRMAWLLLLTPLALVGTVAWFVPYQLPALAVRAAKPGLDAVSTYKLVAAVLAFPLALVAWTLLVWHHFGGWWAAGAALAAVLGGLVWIPWRKALRELGADARTLARSLPRGRTRGRLAEMRAELVREFEAVAERAGTV
jgi:glycerol-3-phosphate O-acyltransferase/dihydroxyacetone phosphate acyltransferase